nr:tegument host shutoff protein [Felid alphaherpesvirus 1]
MGLFGMLKYAYCNRLVKHDAITTPPGIYTPIAIDLWNVMYTLMEKFFPEKDIQVDNATVTAECFFSLLKLLQKRSYFPIFVSDRGIYGDGQVKYGAKAIVTQTMCLQGGSGRLGEFSIPHGGPCEDTSEPDGGNPKDCKVDIQERISARWSSLAYTPRLCYRLCVNLIRYLGYPYVNVSDMEADDVCANLYHTNTVAQIYTTDTDLILMGCDIILDIIPLFPPTIRCRDVLASLNLTYSEFVARFARCHTDLHQTPILKSVQNLRSNQRHQSKTKVKEKVINLKSSTSISRDTSSDASSSEERDIECMSTDTYRISPSQIRGSSKQLTMIEEQSLTLKYTSRYPPIMKTASQTLSFLPPPQTKHEVLERKFIKHLIARMTPETRGRLSILKRVPILQEKANFNLVFETLKHFIGDAANAKHITNLFWKHISTPPDYNVVLVTYWDDCDSRRRL